MLALSLVGILATLFLRRINRQSESEEYSRVG
jgi:hypothetical protein